MCVCVELIGRACVCVAVAKRGRTRKPNRVVDLRELKEHKLKQLLTNARRRIENVRDARYREIVADITARYRIIAVGRVDVASMVARDTRNVSKTTAQSILLAGMGRFTRLLEEAASHQVGTVVLRVNEAYSTATCPRWQCHRVRHAVGAAKQPDCEHCGHVTVSRDAAAAREILVLHLIRRQWLGAAAWAVAAVAADASAQAGGGVGAGDGSCGLSGAERRS